MPIPCIHLSRFRLTTVSSQTSVRSSSRAVKTSPVDRGDMESKTKVFKSALVVIPPPELWAPIQAVRRVHDKNFHRWPPHVNLLYPFWQDNLANFHEAASIIQSALAHVRPFPLELTMLGYFKHGRSCTLWVNPGEPPEGGLAQDLPEPLPGSSGEVERSSISHATVAAHSRAQLLSQQAACSSDLASGYKEGLDRKKISTSPHRQRGTVSPSPALCSLQERLVAAFPGCTDLSDDPERGITQFTPHLSLGQWRDERAIRAAVADLADQRPLGQCTGGLQGSSTGPGQALDGTRWRWLQGEGQVCTFLLDSVYLISRKGYKDPFTVRYRIPLGTACVGVKDKALALGGAAPRFQEVNEPYIAA
eukprot:jgi/Mesvir1/7935/Mv11857-RA.1